MVLLYEIPRRARACAKCANPFLPGASYYSALTESFERSDFCLDCFEKKGSIFWKASIPEKEKQTASNTEKALELLREICQEQQEMAYILALYLQRQKVIIKRHEGGEAILFEVVETEEILNIAKRDLTKLDVEQLQKQIAERLG